MKTLYAEPPARFGGLMEVRGIEFCGWIIFARAQLDIAVNWLADAVPRIAEPNLRNHGPSPAAHPSACV